MKETKFTGAKSPYSSPEAKALSLDAEQVFAASPNSWYEDESNDSNIVWGYSEDEVWG